MDAVDDGLVTGTHGLHGAASLHGLKCRQQIAIW